MTDFATAIQLTSTGDRRWTTTLAADWSQGRTTFGGLLAALAARVAAEVVGAERPIRTMDVAFVAPIPPGLAELEVEELGTGKAVTQVVVSIRSGGVLGCRVHVVAGAARVSAIRVDAVPAESVEGDPAEQGLEFPYLSGLMPAFCQHVEYRWCADAFPFTGGGPETARLKGWARHRTAAQGVEATIAMLDAWPPAVLPMTKGPTPASTVRWALHLVGPNDPPEASNGPVKAGNGVEASSAGVGSSDGVGNSDGVGSSDGAGGRWYWYESRAVHAADGYATAYASLYADGRLVAWSEQLITIYDRPDQAALAQPPARSVRPAESTPPG